MDTEAAWLPATQLTEAVAAGHLDPDQVVSLHLERIRRLDPEIGAYVYVDEGARTGRGPLAGVTLAVKDTQPVRGMPWTEGSPHWRRRTAAEDAVVVARARAAGIAVLGKTNTPELAAAVGTTNPLFPPTHNPWRHGFTPGGSSGGSGAAVAAGLCTIAFGDDMGGSIRIPASCCGVAGLRPTPHRVPKEQPDPIGIAARGPLARTVADLRLAFGLMTGEAVPPTRSPRQLRVAVVEDTELGVEEACRRALRRAADALADAGHELSAASWEPMPVLEAYRVVRPASVSTVPGEAQEYGPAVRGLIEAGRRLSAAQYLRAMAEGMAAAQPVRDLLATCDAILTPTLGRLPMPIDEVPPFLEDDWCAYTQFALPVSFARCPAVSVPAGLEEGLPVGVQLVGRPDREWALLDLAAQLEDFSGFGFRRPPACA
jgi:amidase